MLTGIEIAKRYVQSLVAEFEAGERAMRRVDQVIIDPEAAMGLLSETAMHRGSTRAYASVMELDEQTPVQAWLDAADLQETPKGSVAVERAGESPFYVLTGPGCGHPEDNPEIEAPAWFGFVTQAQLKALFYTIAEVLEADSITHTSVN